MASKRNDGPGIAELFQGCSNRLPVRALRVKVVLVNIKPEELGHLMLVDQKDIRIINQFLGKFRNERRIIKKDGHPVPMAYLCAADHSIHRAFQAQAQNSGIIQDIPVLFHITR